VYTKNNDSIRGAVDEWSDTPIQGPERARGIVRN
jgi:hypothetical protein